LSAANENWFWNLPSGEDILKKISFLWLSRLLWTQDSTKFP
jgi:hypothetical protein